MKNPPNVSVKMIITGGQSGADLAGNEFAKSKGISTCCYVFAGFKPTQKEDWEVLQKFDSLNIKVTRPNDYVSCLRERTIHNVQRADATVIFTAKPLKETRGSLLTWKMCEVQGKPYAIAYTPDWETAVTQIAGMINACRPAVLNIAGERNLDRKVVRDMLNDAWEALKQEG